MHPKSRKNLTYGPPRYHGRLYTHGFYSSHYRYTSLQSHRRNGVRVAAFARRSTDSSAKRITRRADAKTISITGIIRTATRTLTEKTISRTRTAAGQRAFNNNNIIVSADGPTLDRLSGGRTASRVYTRCTYALLNSRRRYESSCPPCHWLQVDGGTRSGWSSVLAGAYLFIFHYPRPFAR